MVGRPRVVHIPTSHEQEITILKRVDSGRPIVAAAAVGVEIPVP